MNDRELHMIDYGFTLVGVSIVPASWLLDKHCTIDVAYPDGSVRSLPTVLAGTPVHAVIMPESFTADQWLELRTMIEMDMAAHGHLRTDLASALLLSGATLVTSATDDLSVYPPERILQIIAFPDLDGTAIDRFFGPCDLTIEAIPSNTVSEVSVINPDQPAIVVTICADCGRTLAGPETINLDQSYRYERVANGCALLRNERCQEKT